VQHESPRLVPFERPAGVAEATAPHPIALAPLELHRGRRPAWPTLAALAFATGIAAVGLGAWSVFTETRADGRAEPDSGLARSLAVLADSSAVRYPLHGSVGRVALVATDNGSAVIALDGLGPAPEGRAYRVWVVAPGSATPVADIEFSGSERVVPLERRLVKGTRVAVTLEPRGEVVSPSRPLRLSTVWE
jgi:anti-sigma-K factor RskA